MTREHALCLNVVPEPLRPQVEKYYEDGDGAGASRVSSETTRSRRRELGAAGGQG